MSRMSMGAAALASLVISTAAVAATPTVNYAAIVRANEAAVAQIKSIYASCGSSASAQAACQKAADKVIKSVNYRISTSTSKDTALTSAVQRATAKQLLQIFNTSLTCPAGSAATCAKQNTKTFGSLTYRITNQAPISPV